MMSDLAAQFPTLIRLAALARAGWRWWASEMSALVPRSGRLSRRRAAAMNILGRELAIAETPETGAPVLCWLPFPPPAGSPVPDLDGRAVEVRLPPQIALRKQLLFPAAAAENLRQVIAFEMDRETPFRAEDVRFDTRVVGRTDRQIRVEILVVPRTAADQAMAAAATLGLTVARLTVAGDAGAPFDLRTDAERPPVRRASRLLLATAAGLAVAATALPVAVNAWNLQRLDERIEAVQQRASLAMRLRDELEQRQGGGSVLDQRKVRTPAAIAVIAELTRRLPDGVWLDQVRLSEADVRIYGYAVNSAELIARLEESPLLANARFETGVMQDPLRKRERFQILARIERTPDAAGQQAEEPR